jgi:amino acid permease
MQVDLQSILVLMGIAVVLMFVYFLFKNMLKLFIVAVILVGLYIGYAVYSNQETQIRVDSMGAKVQEWKAKGEELVQQGKNTVQKGKEVIDDGKELLQNQEKLLENGKAIKEKVEGALP